MSNNNENGVQNVYGCVNHHMPPCPDPHHHHHHIPSDVSKLRFNAYKTVVASYEDAFNIIMSKKLEYGEPAVVAYQADNNRLGLMFGIGSMDKEAPYISTSINEIDLKDAYLEFASKEDVEPEKMLISEIFLDIYKKLSEVNTGADDANDRLMWKGDAPWGDTE